MVRGGRGAGESGSLPSSPRCLPERETEGPRLRAAVCVREGAGTPPAVGARVAHCPVVRGYPADGPPLPIPSPHPPTASRPQEQLQGPPPCSGLSDSLSTRTGPSPSLPVCNLRGGGQGPLHIRLIMPFS